MILKTGILNTEGNFLIDRTRLYLGQHGEALQCGGKYSFASIPTSSEQL